MSMTREMRFFLPSPTAVYYFHFLVSTETPPTLPPSATTASDPRLLKNKKINEEAPAALPEVKRGLVFCSTDASAIHSMAWKPNCKPTGFW
jgi:hypothetical protein